MIYIDQIVMDKTKPKYCVLEKHEVVLQQVLVLSQNFFGG